MNDLGHLFRRMAPCMQRLFLESHQHCSVMKRLLPFILLVCLAAAAEKPTEEVACRGVIEEFIKNGFHGGSLDGASETLDITWVRVKAPEGYAGVRQMLLSSESGNESPLGKVGDVVSFISPRSTLDSAKSEQKREPISERSASPEREAGRRLNKPVSSE